MNLGDIGSAIGGVLSGGLTGLIGVGVQRVFEYKSKQLDVQINKDKYAHEVDMKKADAEIMAQEWAARTKIAQVDATSKEDVAESQAFATALTSEPQRYSDQTKLTTGQEWIMVGLDLLRGIIRPVLTLYLCVLTTIIYYQMRELVGDKVVSPDQAVGLVKLIIETVLYITSTVVLFWFGTRNKEKVPKLK